MLGLAKAVVVVQGVTVEFRPPKLKDLVELEKKLERAVFSSMDRLETQALLLARLGSAGGVPLRAEAILESWTVEDLACCVEAVAPLFQRLTGGAPSSSPAGSSGADSAPTS